MSPLRILIVDDSDVTRHILSHIVVTHPSSNGWTVCGEAADGTSAIEKFKEVMPDMVLLDLAMPGLNGIETARAISAIDPTVPIILFTVVAFDGLEKAARDAGICAIVPKGECWTLFQAIENAAVESERPI